MDEGNKDGRKDEVYSKRIRAGKRTYFFDVKSTKNEDLYITITESKKSTYNGRASFEKHKIFLYKEDFGKFKEGLEDALAKIKSLIDSGEYPEIESEYSDVDFDEFE